MRRRLLPLAFTLRASATPAQAAQSSVPLAIFILFSTLFGLSRCLLVERWSRLHRNAEQQQGHCRWSRQEAILFAAGV